ncbi:NAD-dependent succinate-semialdehyde dehydrogenase [Paenibacillus pasadenensis]|uniref:NAD-dependent succinate-semialdehyde dehydrogenase n=1 Tax=Paenibacillus pasadenensis TaxID=217090 RepID=UPI0020416BD0|nr:NAD-dependent succinate-semialdehyde dehydrogenase [Paenibacillus pasadenensis]MCM3748765.1 NAD-dependent succinate-semialdehyde dehydrogenase [Paenibacillus pasadenensis]
MNRAIAIEGRMYMNGEWVQSSGNGSREVLNPATGEVVGTIPTATCEDAAKAAEHARSAFRHWAKMPAPARAALLQQAAVRIRERKQEIAETLTLEQGKPLSESLGEVAIAADYLAWYGEEARRIYGETVPSSAEDKRILVIRQPVGVVAAITPWNFPASMIARKIGPALAAGCTVVLKPADATPLTAVKLFEVFHECGFPPGVVNLVTGKGSVVGPEWLSNRHVSKIAFTGSTEVGKGLLRDAADQVKRMTMELGGHAPFIVFDDADPEEAAEACLISKFRNAGQTCICANRVYVQEGIAEAFTAKLLAKVKALKIGNGVEPGVEIGPLINGDAREKVLSQVQDALDKGAVLLHGGRKWEPSDPALKYGAFMEPTLLANVNDSMDVCREETFGPIAPLVSFRSEEEVLEKANALGFGLAAYAFTRDLGRSIRVSEGLEYGIVGINDALPTVVQAPFGGWKESGLGSEGGRQGLDGFLETKYISIKMA